MEAERVLTRNNKTWKLLYTVELRAFFGLIIAVGHLKSNNTNGETFWDQLYGQSIFKVTISLWRFKSLIRFLRHNAKATRSYRNQQDKLAPIRDIFESFNINFRKSYLPGENITIDEQMAGV